MSGFTHRIATRDDLPALEALIDAAITELQHPFLTPAQVEASRAIMGLDTQLVEDGTYFIIERDGAMAGCGGWSRRATLFGGDHFPGRSATLLDPATEAARVRAMYTHPRFVRQGVGRLVLALCEAAARAAGFRAVELMATRAGEPLYQASGYERLEPIEVEVGAVVVPGVRMRKALG